MIREIILSKNVLRNEKNYEITVCLVIRIPNIGGFMDIMCQTDIHNQENTLKHRNALISVGDKEKPCS